MLRCDEHHQSPKKPPEPWWGPGGYDAPGPAADYGCVPLRTNQEAILASSRLEIPAGGWRLGISAVNPCNSTLSSGC
jgi:hypothetical protein